MSGMPGTQAALAAGYSKTTAAKRAHELQHQNPAVMAEIEKARQHLQSVTNYTAEVAMAELEAGIVAARAANQHMAAMKGIELKARLNNLIRDKVDLSVTAQLDINKVLEEANARRTRMSVYPPVYVPEDVDPRYPHLAVPGSEPKTPAALPVPMPRSGDDDGPDDIFS